MGREGRGGWGESVCVIRQRKRTKACLESVRVEIAWGRLGAKACPSVVPPSRLECNPCSARTCGRDPIAKLAKVPAVAVPPGRSEMASMMNEPRNTVGGGHKLFPSLRLERTERVLRVPNDRESRRSFSGEVWRKRLDLPSARTRPDKGARRERRLTDGRQKGVLVACWPFAGPNSTIYE